MKKSITISVCLLGAAGIYWFAQAGEMEPPGPPAPTMVTLQEVYDKLDECTGGGLCVPKTGQTGCWDLEGDPIDCAGTGQDGEYQAGVSVDPRFTDNGDGTVTDNLTGLIWLGDANCFGERDWANALSDANGLQDGSCGLTDGSVAGHWRLPNLRELQTLFDFGQHDPALPLGHPFSGVQLSSLYWSSTSAASSPASARTVWFLHGGDGDFPKDAATVSVWPVRDGLGGDPQRGATRPRAPAGDLDPPGPPAPTMVTLQQIYDKLGECTGGGLCGVPKTGQTGCWDLSGNPIDCAGTGQNGEYQTGVSVDPRFTHNGDGTVTDNLTGLVWLTNADCFSLLTWPQALSASTGLQDGSCGLTDESVAGDWRLPNLRELQSLADFGQHEPALPLGHPFSGVHSFSYWSSTSFVSIPDNARTVHLRTGGVSGGFKDDDDGFTWPVRGGR